MISKIIDSDKAIQLQNLLEKKKKVVITSHVSPDGDAIGSSLGLYHYLLALGCEASIIVPNSFPSFFNWMEGINTILVYEKEMEQANKKIEEAEVLFCLDYNSPARTALMEGAIRRSEAQKVMIDHHLEPDDFCDIRFSNTEMSSTCELLFRIICKLGDFGLINKFAAEAIYTGMMTDTGGFVFNSNRAEIYFIISELINKGIDKDQIYVNVYNNFSEDKYRMMGYALVERMKVYGEYNTALISLSNEDQVRFNSQKGDTEGLANLPLNIKNIIFSAFIREDKNQIKISLRSQGNFPTNKFAEKYFGGGGHLNASGGEYKGSLTDAIELFEKALPEYIKEIKR